MKSERHFKEGATTAPEEMQSTLAEIMTRVDALSADLAKLGIKSDPVSTQVLPDQDQANDEDLAKLAKGLHTSRHRRSRYLPPELMGEPFWDIMLDLYVMDHLQEPVSITSCCLASGVPSTTALRWISVLEKQKYIARREDLHDKRRSNIQLTEEGRAAMKTALTDMARYIRRF